MAALLNFTTHEEFTNIHDELVASERNQLCLRMMEAITTADLQTAKLYCTCLSLASTTIQTLLSTEEGTLQHLQATICVILQNHDVNTLKSLLEQIQEPMATAILSTAYSQLAATNHRCSDDKMDVFVQSHLITSMFYAEDQPFEKKPPNKADIDKKVAARLHYLIMLLQRLLKHEGTAIEVDNLFLFDLKQVVINIFMMKNVLPTTQRSIPWLELEFYCVQFIMYYTKDDVKNLFSFEIISKEKLLSYLGCVHALLEAEASRPKQNQKKKKQPLVVGGNDRENVLKAIVHATPQFKPLLQDYNFLRDLHSMHRIGDLIQLARFIDPREKVGQIVIVRALQVLGEHSKSTAQTPKLSADLERRLLRILPEDMLEVMRRLRDDVSHSASVRCAISAQDYVRMQRQLGFIGDAVRHLLADYQHQFVKRVYAAILAPEDKIPALCAHFERNSSALEGILNTDTNKNSFLGHFEEVLRKQNYNRLEEIQRGFASYSKDDYMRNFQTIANLVRSVRAHAREHLRHLTAQFQKVLASKFLNMDRFFRYYNISNRQSDQASGLVKGLDNNMAATPSVRDTIEELAHLLRGYNCRRFVREDELSVAVEMILLEIFSQLEDEKLLTNAHQWIDTPTPVLVGKPFRNHLAHYNALVETLPINQRVAIYQNAKLLINQLQDGGAEAHERRISFEPYYDLGEIEVRVTALRHFASGTTPFLADIVKYPVYNAVLLGDLNMIQSHLSGTSVNVENSFGETPLHFAAAIGHLDNVHLLLRHGADTKAYDKMGFTPLHVAICGNQLKVVEVLLQFEIHVDATRTKSNRSCLHLAAEHSVEIMQMLIARGADLNTMALDMSLLRVATIAQNDTGLQLLLDSGFIYEQADLNACMHIAIMCGLTSTIATLTELGADVNAVVYSIPTIHRAIGFPVEKVSVEMVTLFIARGARLDAVDESIMTPLHLASIQVYPQMVSLLLQKGADPLARDHSGRIALHYACENDHFDLIQMLLLSKPETITWVSNPPLACTPLGFAIMFASPNVVDFFVDNAADFDNLCGSQLDAVSIAIKRQDNYAMCQYLISCELPIYIDDCAQLCIRQNDPSAMQLLLQAQCYRDRTEYVHTKKYSFVVHCACAMMDHRPDVAKVMLTFLNPSLVDNVTNPDQRDTMMHFSALIGDAQSVKILLSMGANPKLMNKQGRTPLDIAVGMGHWFVADALLSLNHSQVEKINLVRFALDRGHIHLAMKILSKHVDKTLYKDLIHLGAFQGSLDLVKFLLGYKVDPRLDESWEPVHAGVAGGHVHVVDYFLKSKRTRETFTIESQLGLMHFAAGFSQYAMAEHLLELGYDINAQDEVGNTALHVACNCGDLGMVKVLLRHGALYNLRNNIGRAPADLARNGFSLQKTFQEVETWFTAVRTNDLKTVRNMHSVPINTADNADGTALHVASKLGHHEMVLILLRKGAQYDRPTKTGELPEDLALDDRSKTSFRFLHNQFQLPAGELFSEEYFISIGSIEFFLQELEAYMFATNASGRTTLQEAICKGYPGISDMILRYSTCVGEFLLGNNMTRPQAQTNLNKIAPTGAIIFADVHARHCIRSGDLTKASILLASLTQICKKSLPPHTAYAVKIDLLLASNEMNSGRLHTALDILTKLFSQTEDITTMLAIYKLAMILSRNQSISSDGAKFLCKKIYDTLLYGFDYSQKEVIYRCLWHKNRNLRCDKVPAIEDFFSVHGPLGYDTFDDAVGITLLPTSKMKLSIRFGEYLDESFRLLGANLEVQAWLKEGNVLKAFSMAMATNEKIDKLDFDLKALMRGFNEYEMRTVALKEGFTEGQIKKGLRYVLHVAATEGDVQGLLKCLKFGADVHEHDVNDMRPIDYALLEGHDDIVHILIKYSLFDTIDRLRDKEIVNEVQFLNDKIALDSYCYNLVLLRRAIENCRLTEDDLD